MCHIIRSYGSTTGVNYHGTNEILYAGYYLSCCILHITIHPSYLKASHHITCCIYFQVCFEVYWSLHLIAHTQLAALYVYNCSLWHTPSLFDLGFPACFNDAPKYSSINTSNYDLNFTSGETLSVAYKLCWMPHTQPAGLYTPDAT